MSLSHSEEKEREKQRVELANREFLEDRMSMEERLKYTGGTKVCQLSRLHLSHCQDSVATKIRTQDEIMGVKPQPIGLPNNNNGGADGEPEDDGGDQDDGH